MMRTSAFCLGLLVAWCPMASIPAVAAGPKFNAEKLAKIPVRMREFVAAGELPGAVTVVGTAEGIVSHEAVGESGVSSARPMPKDALFRIASMTKPITAIAIMLLAEEGKLAVDDPVEKHLPEFRGQMLVAEKTADGVTLRKPMRPMTLRDLLTHTSGLPAFPEGLSDVYYRRQYSLAEATLAMSQRPLDFEPGSKWAYCNSGIDTLGRVVEVVAGQAYEQFLQARIFAPLGMKDTAFYPSPAQLERLAELCDRKEGKLLGVGYQLLGPTANARHPIPAGGLYSTGADLARLYRAMLNKGTLGKTRILSEASVAEMTRVQTGDLQCGFTPGMGFGFGWAVVREPQGVTETLSPGSFGHGGAFGTQAWIDPAKGVFMVLLIQRVGLTNGDASPMRQTLQSATAEALE